jgi:hypothetical protein
MAVILSVAQTQRITGSTCLSPVGNRRQKDGRQKDSLGWVQNWHWCDVSGPYAPSRYAQLELFRYFLQSASVPAGACASC